MRRGLARFQEYDDKRDPDRVVDCIALSVESDDLQVIGTGAHKPGEGSWCLGREKVRDLLLGDWQYRGDLVLDSETAHIHVRNDVARLTTTGTVIFSEPAGETYSDVMNDLQRALGGGSPSPLKLFDIGWTGVDERYIWPLGFTAILVRGDSQMKSIGSKNCPAAETAGQ